MTKKSNLYMIINKHGKLIDTDMAGNGYHGRCEHCNLALVTDLGYCSWDNTKCIDREIIEITDIPDEILSYANFCGLKWDQEKRLFIKPYDCDKYTLNQLNDKIKKLNNK